MDFMLVLQYTGNDCPEYDDLIALEHALTEALSPDVLVDGHDKGSGEANIFILTPDPAATLSASLPVIGGQRRLEGLAAGYRALDSDDYVRLWPMGSTEPFSVL